jgi:hypothetical protein
MLVIIGDLHFTDGTSGTTIGEDAFKVFKGRLRDLAWGRPLGGEKTGTTTTY